MAPSNSGRSRNSESVSMTSLSEWLGSWGSRRQHGFCGNLLAPSRSNARCDHFGRNARLEPVKVFGEFALALDHRDPRPSDLGVFATSLGISRDDRCRSRLDVLRSEELREPLVDVCEQAVFADRQAWRMILEGRRVVGAHATAIERTPAHRVALKPLAASVTDHQSREGVPRGIGSTNSRVRPSRRSYRLGPRVACHERLDSMPDLFFNDRVVRLD